MGVHGLESDVAAFLGPRLLILEKLQLRKYRFKASRILEFCIVGKCMRSTSVRFRRLGDFGKFTCWFWEINLYYLGRWQVLFTYIRVWRYRRFFIIFIELYWYWLVTDTIRNVTNVLMMKNWTTSSTGVVGVRRNRKDKSRSESFLHVKVASERASGSGLEQWQQEERRGDEVNSSLGTGRPRPRSRGPNL